MSVQSQIETDTNLEQQQSPTVDESRATPVDSAPVAEVVSAHSPEERQQQQQLQQQSQRTEDRMILTEFSLGNQAFDNSAYSLSPGSVGSANSSCSIGAGDPTAPANNSFPHQTAHQPQQQQQIFNWHLDEEISRYPSYESPQTHLQAYSGSLITSVGLHPSMERRLIHEEPQANVDFESMEEKPKMKQRMLSNTGNNAPDYPASGAQSFSSESTYSSCMYSQNGSPQSSQMLYHDR
ncbi:hypothetical protein QAD02_005434 [Eretmocerus hayati]|uniref:Uncharacterized protein n=1 Tax=Eretmocerus hayati TaxID=131215 RepID=A0ACC2NVA8_9HYME|nr:hypothetical protein QAD02_005434 [Eretmocerus hayati]